MSYMKVDQWYLNLHSKGLMPVSKAWLLLCELPQQHTWTSVLNFVHVIQVVCRRVHNYIYTHHMACTVQCFTELAVQQHYVEISCAKLH